MTAAEFFSQVLTGDLAWFRSVIPSIPASAEEQVMLCAIPGQESGWQNIQQADGGIARGYYQLQENDLSDVLANVTTGAKAIIVCLKLGISPTGTAVYAALLGNTKLQIAFARLNLWADPHPLPKVGDLDEAYAAYLRIWRPGAPSAGRWADVYPAALAAARPST